MADKSVEQLSVLVDGEFEEWELEFAARRLAGDPVLKTRWEAYHLISDALRNNLPDAIDPRFAERVNAMLAAENPLSTSTKPTVPSWYKPVAGLAVAASVGVLAVALWSLRPDGSLPAVGSNLATNTASVNPPVSLPPSADDSAPDSRHRLNSYLANHNEYASMNSVNGVLPYVRIVGYESGVSPRR
jgi:sigma-E factor negative regulatory protein RseA